MEARISHVLAWTETLLNWPEVETLREYRDGKTFWSRGKLSFLELSWCFALPSWRTFPWGFLQDVSRESEMSSLRLISVFWRVEILDCELNSNRSKKKSYLNSWLVKIILSAHLWLLKEFFTVGVIIEKVFSKNISETNKLSILSHNLHPSFSRFASRFAKHEMLLMFREVKNQLKNRHKSNSGEENLSHLSQMLS